MNDEELKELVGLLRDTAQQTNTDPYAAELMHEAAEAIEQLMAEACEAL